MGHAAKLGRNSKHHNQSGQKEFELLKSQFLANISHELRTPLKEKPCPLTKEEAQRLLHELYVHQIELEMRNEELQQARAEVKAVLGQYTDLYDFAPVGYFTLEPDGTIRQANLTGARLFGAERSRLMNRRFGLFVSDDCRPAFDAFLKKVFEGRARESCKLALWKEGNNPLYVHIEARVSEDGQACRAAVVDITERKRAEEKLRLQSSALESAANAVVITDREGIITWVNPAFTRLTGYSPEEAIGHSPRLLKSGKQSLERYEELWKTILSGQVWSGEIVNRRKDGSIYTEEQTITPVRNDRGQITHFIAIKQDISDQKAYQERIERDLKRIKALQEIDRAITSTLELKPVLQILLEKIDLFLPYSAAGVMLWNKEQRSLDPVACRNIDENEWKKRFSRGSTLALTVLETKAPVVVRNLQTDPRTRDPRFFRQQGIVSYLGIPLVAKEVAIGVLAFYTRAEHEFTQDETEFLSALSNQAAIAIHNAQLYDETTKLSSDLSRSNSVKDEFLSVMSHELRTPLNVVMGYTAMMKDGMLGDVNSKQDEALGKILGRANDQLALINNILYATFIEATKMPVDRQVVILADLFSDLESAYFASAISRDLTLSWDCPPGLPILETDRAKLKQILQNLIDNAIKFTDKGSVTISARIGQQAEGNKKQKTHASRLSPHAPNSWVEIKVADTGCGIPKDALPLIFDKFRQVDSYDTRLFGGVGMGLYIVKKFTELLGGTIEVESEEGKGSTFRVILPRESPNAGKDSDC